MSLELEIVNPLNFPGWDKLILSTQGYSFFHSSAWAKILTESYNYKPLYFTLFNDNKILALVPIMEINSNLNGQRGISLPFTDYCVPLISKEINFEEILNYLINYGEKSAWKYLEFRGDSTLFKNIAPSSAYFHHEIDLSEGEDYIFSKFRGSTKRNIKKAIREGVTVKICNSLKAITEYYRLHCKTRKGQGIPPQPFYFFKNIYKYILSKNKGFIILASHEGKNIAGKIYFHFGRNAIFKFGGSDKKYLYLRPNNLIMWEAIKWFSKQGFKSMDLGRTELENEGLRRYKTGWGTTESIISYYKYDLRSNVFVTDNQMLNKIYKPIFRTLPICVLKTIGCLSYRHVG